MTQRPAADVTAGRMYSIAPGGSGVALGRLYRTDRPMTVTGSPDGIDAAGRIAGAFAATVADLELLVESLAERGQQESAAVTAAILQIGQDPDLRAMVDDLVAGGATPESAVQEATGHYASLLAALLDAALAARAADVRAVGRRLVEALGGRASAPPEGALVLVAREITADDLLRHEAVAGAASVIGGATSHAGIIARSLGVPIAFGADPEMLEAADGEEALLDLAAGELVVAPPVDRRDRVLAAQRVASARRDRLAADRHLPVTTRDGHEVTVLANVASVGDADMAVRMGASGIGLLRTEMPFLTARHWPTLAEHHDALAPVLKRLDGLAVTVRTLDFADDKLPPFLRGDSREPGQRSLSLMLAEPEAFSDQVRSLIGAGAGVGLRIMFPMVASAGEMRQCRALVDRVLRETCGAPIPVGAMIEVVEAVADIDGIAASADFLSLGTNDLAASVLGIDRRDPTLTPVRVREPAVVAAVSTTVAAGARHGIPVSVCGDAASEPATIELLLGAGCRVLSVAPSMMDEVRAIVRSLDAAACAAVVEGLLAQRGAVLSPTIEG
jgi:phosphoenolpyruvate-protein kinase (PTS system EI component)